MIGLYNLQSTFRAGGGVHSDHPLLPLLSPISEWEERVLSTVMLLVYIIYTFMLKLKRIMTYQPLI